MSKLVNNFFLIFLPTSLVTLLAYYLFSHSQQDHLQQLKRPPLLSSFTSKGLSTKLIDVELQYDSVETHAEEVEIRAYVTMPFNFSGPVNFRWKLGENVTLVEGLTTGALENFLKGEAKLLTVKIKGFSRESNRHIRLEVIGLQNGRGIYGESLAASDMENTFENIVQNVERIKTENKEEN